MHRLVPVLALVAAPVLAGPTVAVRDGQRVLLLDGREVLTLNTPWVANAGWQAVHTAPAALPPVEGPALRRSLDGPHGHLAETITTTADAVTIRYEFAYAELPDAAHVQWYWRLPAEVFDGVLVSGAGDRQMPLRPIEGAGLAPLREMAFVLPDADLSVSVAAADGTWSFQDARRQAWAKCYRLEWNRDFAAGGRREGWLEVTIRGGAAAPALVPLTTGPPVTVRGVSWQPGPLTEAVNQPLAGLLLWHTATGPAARGELVGEVVATYADGATATVPLRWDEAVADPHDDPRDLPEGGLLPLPDGSPAWVTAWRNPRPEVALAGLTARSAGAGWRLVAAAGINPTISPARLAAVLRVGRSQRMVTDDVRVSLDGTWRIRPAGQPEQDIAVPSWWETVSGLRGVHEAVFQRTFDVPEAMAGQRIALRFDSVGDFAEVRVDGAYAGQHLGPAVPFEVDLTGLVQAPSSGHTLEVTVKDDRHFSVPRPAADWRDVKHWIPRGPGTNNRKGLWQSVALVGRPPVHIADARVQTSVRQRTLTVHYEVFNPRRETVDVTLTGQVRPAAGGEVALTLPPTQATLGGQVTTTVTVTVPWADPVLWQPDHPQLYRLRTILADQGGERLHRHEVRFGFREAWFEGIHFYLNGIRCNLRGESPAYRETPSLLASRAGAEQTIRKYLAANFNVLRFHSIPPAPHVQDVCDELGMMVIAESAIYASWLMLSPDDSRWLPECRRHLTAWVRRDRNHPSVLLWSAENEGLNVSVLSPAQLAEFKQVVDAHDGTRPVIFDGDGTGYGLSPASVKHYVRTVEDLQDRGGRSSGYGRDLRDDIYWATAYQQDVPLGIGEALFPATAEMKQDMPRLITMMGLQTRGYRAADWFDIRPYNPSYSGFLKDEPLSPELQRAHEVVVKSFAPVAVYDRDYDALGAFPPPFELAVGRAAPRTLLVYNDTFADETVTVSWTARQGDQRVGGESRELRVPLGGRVELPLTITPAAAGPLLLELTAAKAGREVYRDTYAFVAQ